MNGFQATASLLRKIAFLAVVGFLVLTLTGPVIALVAAILSVIIAIVSVVLPFALIGFLVWTAFELVFGDRHLVLHRIRETGRAFYQGVVAGPLRAGAQSCRGAVNWSQTATRGAQGTAQVLGSVLALPFRLAATVARGGFGVVRFVARKVAGVGRFFGEVFVEALCGAFVGALLAALGVTRGQDPETVILIGAGLGGVLGILLSASRPAAQPELPLTGEPQQAA